MRCLTRCLRGLGFAGLTTIAMTPVLALAAAGDRAASASSGRELNPPAAVRLRDALAAMPLRFEDAGDQRDGGPAYIARSAASTVYLQGSRATLLLISKTAGATLDMRLLGANPSARAEPRDELPGRTNHLIGNDRSKWRTGVRGFSQLAYREVYPGIDIVYYGNPRQLEYDFVVAPGADPRRIAIAFDGARHLSIDEQTGDLIIATTAGDVVQHAPILYQRAADGSRESIAGAYVLRGGARVGVRTAAYDRRRALVIDPVLTYSTYLGGAGSDGASGLAVDADGTVYVAGQTGSADFPQVNAGQPTYGGGQQDVFVAKMTAAGDALIYATYLGGSSYESITDLDVDAEGNAYVTGSTASANFPTVGAIQNTLPGVADGFVTKLDASGRIAYSTYLGGSGYDRFSGIAVDAHGRAHVVGGTMSTDFPVVNALQPRLGGHALLRSVDAGASWDGIDAGLNTLLATSVAVDPTQTGVIWASTAEGIFKTADFGETWTEMVALPVPVMALALNPRDPSVVYAAAQNLILRSRDAGASWQFVGVFTGAVNVLVIDPVTPTTIYAGTEITAGVGVMKSTDGGDHWFSVGMGGTVVSLAISPSNPSVLYAGTMFAVFKTTTGGSGVRGWTPMNTGMQIGRVHALAVDPADPSIAYAGNDQGLFKTVTGGAQWVPAGTLNGAPVVSLAIPALAPSTVYAGLSSGGAVSHDSGQTWTRMVHAASTLWRLTTDPRSATDVYAASSHGSDAFVVRLSPDGSSFEYSTYWGGSKGEAAGGVALARSGDVYVTGETTSDDLPVLHAAQSTRGGGVDAINADVFVAKLTADGAPSYATYVGGADSETAEKIAVDAAGRAYVSGITMSQDFPTVHAYQTALAGPDDAFVTALDPAGATFMYSTYLGGTGSERGTFGIGIGFGSILSIAVSPSGDAFVNGTTESPDFPTVRALQPAYAGGQYDTFVTKLTPEGLPSYSTYLGGRDWDSSGRIAVDSLGTVVVTGFTRSVDFPTRAPLQAANAGAEDVFIARIAEDTPDPTPPVSTIDASGIAGLDGWFRSAVAVTLSAADAEGESGPAFVDYSLDEGWFVRYRTPFTLDADGVTSVRARATDNSGHVEDPPASRLVRVDTTAPVVTVTTPEARDYLHSESLVVAFSAADALSGLAPGAASAVLNGSTIVTDGQTLDLLTLPLGPHVFTVAAADRAGNSNQQTITFRITATLDSLVAAVSTFVARGQIDPQTENGLLAKLTDAREALERGNLTVARNKLRDFMHAVSIHSGGTIATAAADVLLADAQYVFDSL